MLRPSHLRASPLSPAVPLDGTDTVPGLQTLDRQQRTQRLTTLSRADLPRSGGGQAHAQQAGRVGRDRYTHFKGPFVEQLPFDALKQPPRPWVDFFHNGWEGRMRESYNVPEDLDMLMERLDENMSFYVCNYLRVTLVLFALVAYTRPWAIPGLVALVLSAYFSSLASQESNAVAVRDRQLDSSIQMFAVLGMIACWVVTVWCGAWGALSRWLLATLGAVAGHAATRRAPGEYRGLRKGQPPRGVPFLVVAGIRWGGSALEDPHRVFKELGAAGWGAMTALADIGRHEAGLWWRSIWAGLNTGFQNLNGTHNAYVSRGLG